MSAKRRDQATETAGPLEDALEELYAAPLEGFVSLRRELAGKLRAAGEVAASRVVASANKPSRTAWAINQVARRDADRLRELFGAWDEAAAAQKEGDADEVRAKTRQYRDRASEVTNAARDLLVDAGANPNPALLRQIGASLQAASAGGAAARADLLAGRLSNEIDSDDPLAGLEIGPPAPRRSRDATPKGPANSERRTLERSERADGKQNEPEAKLAREREQERARERQERKRRIEEARELVRSLEDKARAARSAAREGAAAAKLAEREAARASQTAAEADARLEAARAELKSLIDPHWPV